MSSGLLDSEALLLRVSGQVTIATVGPGDILSFEPERSSNCLRMTLILFEIFLMS